MQVIRDLKEYDKTTPVIATIGVFDGVHIGHQKILSEMVNESKEKNCKSMVFTFHPHPRHILYPDSPSPLINTIEERISHLEQIGIDIVVVYPFTKNFSTLSSDDFTKKILVDSIGITKIIIGYNQRFGYNREGDISHLKTLGSKYGFDVNIATAQSVEGTKVSSTKIRELISQGDMPTTKKYLNRPFSLSGKVIKGEQIGRKIGFPTANIFLDNEKKILPKKGVYFVGVLWNKRRFFGMMNIGNKPTLKNRGLSVEVHIFNFNNDIYEETITIEFYEFIREEKSFSSLELLKSHLEKDKTVCENILKTL